MTRLFLSFIVCLVVLTSATAHAQVPQDPDVGVQLGAGVATFFGGLGESAGTPFYDLQIETLFVRADTLPLIGYLAINGLSTSTTQSSPRFPFGQGATVDVLAFLFIPTLCWQPGSVALVCGGIGQGTVNVNREGEERDYGTWNYQASLKLFLVEHWSLSLVGKYVGRVEQVVEGEGAYFTFATAGLGVGWMW